MDAIRETRALLLEEGMSIVEGLQDSVYSWLQAVPPPMRSLTCASSGSFQSLCATLSTGLALTLGQQVSKVGDSWTRPVQDWEQTLTLERVVDSESVPVVEAPGLLSGAKESTPGALVEGRYLIIRVSGNQRRELNHSLGDRQWSRQGLLVVGASSGVVFSGSMRTVLTVTFPTSVDTRVLTESLRGHLQQDPCDQDNADC